MGRASASRDAAGLRSKLEWLWVAIPCIPPPDPAHPPRLLHVSPTAGTSAPALPSPPPAIQAGGAASIFPRVQEGQSLFPMVLTALCLSRIASRPERVQVIPHIRPHGELIPWPGRSHPRWIYSPLCWSHSTWILGEFSYGSALQDTPCWSIHSVWVGGEASPTPCPHTKAGGFQQLLNPGSSRTSRAALGAQTEPLRLEEVVLGQRQHSLVFPSNKKLIKEKMKK